MPRWGLIINDIVDTVVDQDSKPTLPGNWVDVGNANFGDIWGGGTPQRPKRWVITNEAFWNRFTTAERIALDVASQHDPAAANPAKNKAGRYRVLTRDIDKNPTIKLKANWIENFVRLLETDGVLATGRADTILLTEAGFREQP